MITTNGYVIREIDRASFRQMVKKYSLEILGDGHDNERDHLLSHLEKNQTAPSSLNLGVFDDSKFIGWSTGHLHDGATFYIENSAIHRDHQRRGLHAALLNEMIRRAAASGFQTVKNHHYFDLSKLIAKKLRMGFVITGVEISDDHRPVLQMEYYLKKERFKILQFRNGDVRPKRWIWSLFNEK